MDRLIEEAVDRALALRGIRLGQFLVAAVFIGIIVTDRESRGSLSSAWRLAIREVSGSLLLQSGLATILVGLTSWYLATAWSERKWQIESDKRGYQPNQYRCSASPVAAAYIRSWSHLDRKFENAVHVIATSNEPLRGVQGAVHVIDGAGVRVEEHDFEIGYLPVEAEVRVATPQTHPYPRRIDLVITSLDGTVPERGIAYYQGDIYARDYTWLFRARRRRVLWPLRLRRNIYYLGHGARAATRFAASGRPGWIILVSKIVVGLVLLGLACLALNFAVQAVGWVGWGVFNAVAGWIARQW